MTLTRTNIRFTASGMEVPAVTAEQMREVDRIAMQETGPNLFQMMENAGRNLAALSMELLGNGWQQASYLVLAGSGGNGGGGICAGRHLANHGCRVSLCLADPEQLGEVPGACMRPRWTMTLALPKTGLLPDTIGDLFLADIGIPQGAYQRMQIKYVSPFGKGYRMRLAAEVAPSEER